MQQGRALREAPCLALRTGHVLCPGGEGPMQVMTSGDPTVWALTLYRKYGILRTKVAVELLSEPL